MRNLFSGKCRVTDAVNRCTTRARYDAFVVWFNIPAKGFSTYSEPELDMHRLQFGGV
jgi:hypothetical protein